MNKVKILLVRHGKDEDNANGILNGHRDKPLTDLGRKQAKTVGQDLKSYHIDCVYSSPLQRAKETAEIIAKELNTGLKVKIHPKLIERDFGILTGKPLTEIPRYAPKTMETDRVLYFIEAEKAEDFPSLLKRARSFIEEMNHKHPGKTILAVTHGNTGKMIRAAYYDWPWEKGLKTPYFANSEVIILEGKEESN